MIKENIARIRQELPPGVELEAAAKTRSIAEIQEALAAGVKIIGENYVQEAQKKFTALDNSVCWHFIGHLQKNKAKPAVKIFDMIETLDSFALAQSLNKECKKINKIMPVLVEINSAGEPRKAGLRPQDVEGFVREVIKFERLKPMGLMTMGPLLDNPEDVRPFFKLTREIFDKIKEWYKNPGDWKYLSMGMSDTYRVAYQEGANIVRVGTGIFGPRR